ncbi:conserved hypothetical protein [Vibrio coralliirubri]|nr:conserved hypothetical protein [Vibrio coralliirubri]
MLNKLTISWMIDTIVGHHITNIKRVYPFQTADVKTVFIWARTALMMGIDATVGAEVMLSGIGIKLIQLEMLRTFEDLDAIQRNRAHNRSPTTTDGTITAAWLFYPVR